MLLGLSRLYRSRSKPDRSEDALAIGLFVLRLPRHSLLNATTRKVSKECDDMNAATVLPVNIALGLSMTRHLGPSCSMTA